MKRVKAFFCVVAVFFLCGHFALQARANELEGFRGLRWGTGLSSLGYAKFIEEIEGIKYYRKMNDEMHLGTAGIKDIAYAYSQKGLVGVIVFSKGKENARLIFETLKHAYSAPSKRGENNYYWRFGGESSIFYNFNPSSENLFVSYMTQDVAGKLRLPRQR
ncbi:MAG: hypothetical protein LBT31_02025 [Synergistaceae bacterium]|nr:hypothetical protein [Synergistaceae bacterium]